MGWRVGAKIMAELAGRAALLVLLVVAARTLTGDEFGRYAYALACGVIAAQLASGGLQVALLRRLAVAGATDEARQAFGDALRARAVAGAVFAAAAALLAASVAVTPAEAVVLAALAVAPVLAAHGELWLQAPRAVGRLEVEALAALGGRLAVALAGMAVLLAGFGLPGLAVAHVGGSALALVVSRQMARRYLVPGSSGGWAAIRSWYRESLPLAIAGVASLLMFRIDVLLIELLRDVETVGLYTVAYRPFETTLVVSVAVMSAAFPRLSRQAVEPGPASAFMGTAARTAAALLLLALSIVALGWWLGPPILAAAFGPAYEPAGDLLKILLVALPPMFLNALLTQSLIALDRRWPVAVAMAAAFAVNVTVNLWLIPGLGATGAAIATLAAEATLFLVAGASLVFSLGRWRRAAP